MQGDPTAKTDSSIANLASRIPVLVYASGELMHAVRKGQYAVERESTGDVQAGGPQQCFAIFPCLYTSHVVAFESIAVCVTGGYVRSPRCFSPTEFDVS
jgi:hypothetical protein